MHRGRARAGIAHPGFKHGRYSLVLPRGLLQDYAAAQRDPQWLSLRDELALTDARILAYLRRVESGDPLAVLTAARRAYASYRAAVEARDPRQMSQALQAIGAALSDTSPDADFATSETLTALLDLRKRLIEAQARLMKDLHQMLSLDRVLAIMDHVASLVRQYVTDPDALRGIQEGLTRLLVASPPETDARRSS